MRASDDERGTFRRVTSVRRYRVLATLVVAPRRTSGSARPPLAMLRIPLMELYSHPPSIVHGVTAARPCVKPNRQDHHRSHRATVPHIGRNGPPGLGPTHAEGAKPRIPSFGKQKGSPALQGPKSPNSLIAQRLVGHRPALVASASTGHFQCGTKLLVLLVLCY